MSKKNVYIAVKTTLKRTVADMIAKDTFVLVAVGNFKQNPKLND